MVKLSKQASGSGSIRTLNSKHLVVDWMGNNNLFYRMTKARFRAALKKKMAVVKQELRNESPETNSFELTIHPNGAMNIGCEYFTKNDVRKIKRWAKEGK